MNLTSHRLSGMLLRLNGAVLWLKQHRKVVIVPFAAIFIVGLAFSFHRLGVDPASLAATPALLLFGIVAPLGLVYGATGLMLLARILGTSIGFSAAWQNAGYAQLAETLPLPGGAIVRTAALMQSGSSTGKSVFIVTATAVMWIAIAAVGASIALFDQSIWAAIILLVAGIIVLLPIMVWLVKQAGLILASVMLAHRLIGLALMALRMLLSFAIIHHLISAEQALLFSFANIAGSASAIAPAGLGVGEAIGALLASLVNIDPAAAFLAIGLNRIIGLVSCAVIVLLGNFANRQKAAPILKKALK